MPVWRNRQSRSRLPSASLRLASPSWAAQPGGGGAGASRHVARGVNVCVCRGALDAPAMYCRSGIAALGRTSRPRQASVTLAGEGRPPEMRGRGHPRRIQRDCRVVDPPGARITTGQRACGKRASRLAPPADSASCRSKPVSVNGRQQPSPSALDQRASSSDASERTHRQPRRCSPGAARRRRGRLVPRHGSE